MAKDGQKSSQVSDAEKQEQADAYVKLHEALLKQSLANGLKPLQAVLVEKDGKTEVKIEIAK